MRPFLMIFLQALSLLHCVHAKPFDQVQVLSETKIANQNENAFLLPHARTKRDELSSQASGQLDDLGSSANDAINQASGKFDEIGSEANAALGDVGSTASQNINKFGEQASENLNKFGEEASNNLNRVGEEATRQFEKFGEEATKNLNKFGEDATKELNTALKNFEGTANDLSNYANTKGQQSLDDLQLWFKEKLVLYLYFK